MRYLEQSLAQAHASAQAPLVTAHAGAGAGAGAVGGLVHDFHARGHMASLPGMGAEGRNAPRAIDRAGVHAQEHEHRLFLNTARDRDAGGRAGSGDRAGPSGEKSVSPCKVARPQQTLVTKLNILCDTLPGIPDRVLLSSPMPTTVVPRGSPSCFIFFSSTIIVLPALFIVHVCLGSFYCLQYFRVTEHNALFPRFAPVCRLAEPTESGAQGRQSGAPEPQPVGHGGCGEPPAGGARGAWPR